MSSIGSQEERVEVAEHRSAIASSTRSSAGLGPVQRSTRFGGWKLFIGLSIADALWVICRIWSPPETVSAGILACVLAKKDSERRGQGSLLPDINLLFTKATAAFNGVQARSPGIAEVAGENPTTSPFRLKTGPRCAADKRKLS
jgi:hypothetical protein